MGMLVMGGHQAITAVSPFCEEEALMESISTQAPFIGGYEPIVLPTSCPI